MINYDDIVKAGAAGIDGWVPEVEYGAGSICWSKPDTDVRVYASPFWEDRDGIEVQAMRDGDCIAYMGFELARDASVEDYLSVMRSRWSVIMAVVRWVDARRAKEGQS